MVQDVFIIGATGKVGKELVDQIVNHDINPINHQNPTRIVGMASSTDYIFSEEDGGLFGVDLDFFIKENSHGTTKYNELTDLLKVVKGKDDLVFIDVTAVNEPMTEFHLKVIEETPFSIVTANKNPISLSNYATFKKLTSDVRRYGYRCSVMAGAEAVTFLQDLKDVNDQVQIIEGCFSGTLGYITSELEKGRPFSKILREARNMGYTEPDPRDDLNGLDVARKLIVLARTAGYEIEIGDIDVEPFIPAEYFSDEGVDEFLERTKELDLDFATDVNFAKNVGKALRYVAHFDWEERVVGLQTVQKDSPLGSLQGTLNKLVVVSGTYDAEAPYSVEAPGAGLQLTAQNIRRDLLYLLKDRKI